MSGESEPGSRYPAVVTAAGRSRRMGRPKLLLPFRGGTVLEATVAALRAGGCAPVVVVLGAGRPEAEELAVAAARAGAEVAWNPAPDRAMLESVRCGVQAARELVVEDELGGVLVTPGDLPALLPSTVAAVRAALAAGAALALPRHRGRRGHPLGVAAGLLAEVAALDPGVGLRELRLRHAALARELDVDDQGAVAPLDTPADLAALRARFDSPGGGG
jgi:CTP:molybdopterin cytidylyltransferase MocA